MTWLGMGLLALAIAALCAAAGGALAHTRGQRRALSAVERALAESAQQCEALRGRNAELERQEAALRAELDGERRRAAEQKATQQTLWENAEGKLREAFQGLSAQALRENHQTFLELAKSALGEQQRAAAGDLEIRQKAIDTLLAPLRESLGKVDAKLQEVEKQRFGQHLETQKHLELVAQAQQKLESETANLVRALRSPTTRGRWGEIQLRRVVELAGMLERCDFEEQPSRSTEGGRLRPDLVVHLPGEKDLVVDAKAPLAAYLEALEAEDGASREAKLREHARQVREHIRKLASKEYWAQFDASPEFAVMFLPGEAFFSAALQRDPTLIEYGVEARVLLASPITLIALLRAAAYGWQQERIAAGAAQISRLGRELYERVGKVAEHITRLGNRLGESVSAYNDAVASLESRVLVSARRFRELGAAPPEQNLDEIPPLDAQPRQLRASADRKVGARSEP